MSHEGNDWLAEKELEEYEENLMGSIEEDKLINSIHDKRFKVIVDAIEAMKEDSFFDRMYYTVQRLGRVQGKNYVDAELQHLQNFIATVEKDN